MPRSVARPSGTKQIAAPIAKQRVLGYIAEGQTREEAMRRVGRAVATYDDWYKHDDSFKTEILKLRGKMEDDRKVGRLELPDFEVFCRDWLNAPLFPHQLRIWDVLEGREPRDLHPSITYEPGDPTRVLNNMPPSHAKTQTFSIHYPVHKILENPDVKIVIISKSQGLAKQILAAVKFLLTSPVYARLQMAFGPEGGFKESESSWTQTEIYVAGRGGASSASHLVAKDPTMQAIGLGGQLYGARSDIIILDDCITLANVTAHEQQMAWLRQEADTRLPPDGGLLLISGTRVAPIDLYKEVRSIEDLDGGQYFTYIAQPAVLDYGDDGPDDWTTLWPEEQARDGSMVPRWTGRRLAKKRAAVGERPWALVYQQQDVLEDAVFKQGAVEASINGNRNPGVMVGPEKRPGDREGGMQGLYIVGGLDPATVGCTAMVVVGVDRTTQKRYVLDGFNKANTSPQLMRDTVKNLTETYGINEWVIERNAFQRFLTQDPELKQFLFQHGCKLTEHTTGNNKTDPDFGVMSMGPLFDSCGEQLPGRHWKKTPDTALIELPKAHAGWTRELVSQLITWAPSGLTQSTKTDLVMALWFTEIAAKKVLGIGKNRATHLQNKWLSNSQRGKRQVIDLAAAREARSQAAEEDDFEFTPATFASWSGRAGVRRR